MERVNDFFAVPAFFGTADQVIGDAIVAAEDGTRDKVQAAPRWSAVACANRIHK
jgi:hypothetical protein